MQFYEGFEAVRPRDFAVKETSVPRQLSHWRDAFVKTAIKRVVVE